MFEAYKVGIKLSLINHVSPGLLLMSKQLSQTDKAAELLQTRLNKIRPLGMTGAAPGRAGFMGLSVLAKMIKPAEEYARQLNTMNTAGLKHKEMADAIGTAWKTTGAVITTTASENLRSLMDLRNVMGNMEKARMALPVIARVQAVLAASSEGQIAGNAKELAYSMAKELAIGGAAKSPEMFARQAELMAKVIIATHGRVTPEALNRVFARQAKFGLGNEYGYEILPSLIRKYASSGGGGSGGVEQMHAAFARWALQGYINRQSMPELAKLGLIDPNTALAATTSGTGAMKAAELAKANPFAWVQEALVPAIENQYGKNLTRDQLMPHILEIARDHRLAAKLIMEFAFKPNDFLRDQASVRGTMSTADAYKAAISGDLNTAEEALGAQWINFKTALMLSVVPVLIPALNKISSGLQDFARWARENQPLVKNLVTGFAALAGTLAFGGVVVAVTAGLSGLGTVLGLISWPVIAFTAGIVGIYFALKKLSDWIGSADNWFAKGLRWLENGSTAPIGVNQGRDLNWFMKDSLGFNPIAPARANYVQVNAVYNIDGRKIAEHVSTHQARSLAGPQRGTSFIDTLMGPPPVGIPALGPA